MEFVYKYLFMLHCNDQSVKHEKHKNLLHGCIQMHALYTHIMSLDQCTSLIKSCLAAWNKRCVFTPIHFAEADVIMSLQ